MRVGALVRCVVTGFVSHEASALSAAVAYYALLSVFPLALLATALAAGLADQASIHAALSRALATHLPPQAAAAVEAALAQAVRTRIPAGAAALVVFLWSGSAATGAVRRALNRVWEASTRRPFWRAKLVDLAATALLAPLLGASVSLAVAREVLARVVPPWIPGVSAWLAPLDILGRISPPILLACTYLLAYRMLPARRLPWRALVSGALCSAVLTELARTLVFPLVRGLTAYQAVYGSLAGVIVFLLWAYVSAAAFLLGAEVARCVAASPRAGTPC